MKHDSRNLRYGSTATFVTVMLLVSIILINVVMTALQSKYALYTDMTSKTTYSTTKEAKLALADVKNEVKIIFCHERDYVYESSYLHDVLLTAENLAREFEWLEVVFIDSVTEPTLVSKYKLNSADAVNQTDVIIESGDEYRKLGYKSFYVVDTDGTTVWGLKAEQVFASAILGVTAADIPVAHYTNTHGEEISPYLLETIYMAGYEIVPIDLTKDEIDPDARLIIINGPKYDFSANSGNTDGAATSELEKIDKFLTQSFGSLMVFVDPEANDLKNLEQYLNEWGVVFDNNIVKDNTQSITIDGQSVVAEYCTDDTLASNLIDEIATLATRPKTIFKNAGTISISSKFTADKADDSEASDGLGAPTGSYSYSSVSWVRDIAPVFTTGAEATAIGIGSSATEGVKIPANLMTISRQAQIIDQATYNSYVLCANTVFFSDSAFIKSNVYANRDVIFAALKQFGRENVPSGIGFKEYANYDIEDMTTSEADSATVLLMTVLPISFAVVGFVICIRRKYR